jgi:hypothetical protein
VIIFDVVLLLYELLASYTSLGVFRSGKLYHAAVVCCSYIKIYREVGQWLRQYPMEGGGMVGFVRSFFFRLLSTRNGWIEG